MASKASSTISSATTLIFIDIETTTLDANKGAILELYFEERDHMDRIVARGRSLYSARSGALIDPVALQINGLDPDKLANDGYKSFEQNVPTLKQWLLHNGAKRDVAFVGWNVSFDIKHIVAGIRRTGDEQFADIVAFYPQIDAKVVVRDKLKQVGGSVPVNYKLGSVVEYMGFNLNKMDGAHTARGDVQRVCAVLNEIANKPPIIIRLLKIKWAIKRMFVSRPLLSK